MEPELKGSEIIFSKELSLLDNFVLDFVNILSRHNIRYVIVSGYIVILFGMNRISEDADVLIHRITFEKFLKFWLEIEKSYDCLDTNDPIDAYNGYLRNHHAIRIAKKGSSIPNIELKFVKNEFDRSSMKYRKSVELDEKTIYISPLEIQIPYKLFMGREKDIEDARFLFKLFKDKLNMELLKRSLTDLNIPQESIDRYLE